MATESIQNRISFYQNIADSKNQIMKSETQRLQLEKEFYKNVNSDKRYVKEKALKLQAYYKKLCDDERTSSLRNQQILSDMTRIDQHLQFIESKVERLATLKKECEKHIQNNYPQWNEIKQNILNKINNNDNQNNDYNPSSVLINSNLNKQNQYNIQSGLQNFGEIQNRLGTYLSNTNSNENTAKLSNNSTNIQEQMRQNFLFKPDLSYLNNNSNQQQASTGGSTSGLSGPKQVDNQQQLNNNNNNNPYGINNLVMKHQQENELNSSKYRSNQVNEPQANVLHDLIFKPNLLNEHDSHDANSVFLTEALIKSNPLLNSSTKSNPTKPPQGPNDSIFKEYEREIALQDGTYINQTTPTGTHVISEIVKANQLVSPNRNQPSWTTTQIVRNFGESNHNPYNNENPATVMNNNHNRSDDTETEDFSRRRKSLRQELNVSSLYKLLDIIESDMSHTIHPQKYYRQDQPHYKTKLDIIKLARENKSLEDIDAGSVSMVVHDQLPVVIRKHTKNSCLFTREMLSFSVTDINEAIVEKHLTEPKDKELWRRLLKHFCLLKRFCSIDSAILANLFAPCLLAQDGFGTQKAIQFLEKIINVAVINYDFDKSEAKTESSYYDEFNANSKLKDTKIYQNFIMSNNKKPQRISDEDDEIENIVAPKGTGTMSSGSGTINSTGLQPAMPPAIISRTHKSPRATNQMDPDFDFSQSSSDQKQESGMLVFLNKNLNSAKQMRDNRNPVHLRDYDDSDIEDSENSNNLKSSNTYNEGKPFSKNKISDPSLEFYQ